MGTCRFCGENAGLLQREHRRCRSQREAGLQNILRQANQLIGQPDFNEAAMRQSLMEVADRDHIAEHEVNAVISASWTRGIGHPMCGLITRGEAERQRSFREVLQPTDSWMIDSDEDPTWMPLTDRLLLRALRAALGREDSGTLLEDLEEAQWDRQFGREVGRWIMTRGWEKAVVYLLEEGIVTLEQEITLARFTDRHQFRHMESVQWGSIYTDLVQSAILRDISQGVIPQRRQYLEALSPRLDEDETLVWVSDYVGYLQDYRKNSPIPHHHDPYPEDGVRIPNGTYYPPRSFWNPDIGVERGWPDDTGLLVITTRSLRFAGTTKRFRIRYESIEGFEHYGNGIGIGQKARRGQHRAFVTGEGWFIYNLVTSLAANLGRLIPPMEVPRTYDRVFSQELPKEEAEEE